MLAEKKRKTKWVLNPTKKPLWTTDSVGMKFSKGLMEKMGWSAGKGLGVNEQGIQEPLKVSYKNDTKGMGFKGNDEDWIEHQDEFNSFLNELRNSDETFVVKGDKEKKEVKSLEEKSKWSKARVHYQKFTRGKDLSRYTENDLACILGTALNKKEESKTEVTNKEDSKSNDDFETNFGVTTINSGSIQDYFKKKWIIHKKGTGTPDDGEEATQTKSNENPNLQANEEDDIQGNSKKHSKKRKHKLMVEECMDVETISTPQSDELEKSEKKKKKKKIEKELNSEEEPVEKRRKNNNIDLMNDVLVEEANSLKQGSKKKRNKSCAYPNSQYPPEQVDGVDEGEELKDQKKKKKEQREALKEKLENEDMSSIQNMFNGDLNELCFDQGASQNVNATEEYDETLKKKKKKSKKEKYSETDKIENKVSFDISDQALHGINIAEIQSCKEVELVKKKKKKEKSAEDAENLGNQNCELPQPEVEESNKSTHEKEVESDKKKKKKKQEKKVKLLGGDEVELINLEKENTEKNCEIEFITEAVKERKKKKKKEKSESEAEVILELGSVKKKKNKEVLKEEDDVELMEPDIQMENHDETVEIEVLSESVRKKKRKRNVGENSVENECNKNYCEVEVISDLRSSMKKKKQKDRKVKSIEKEGVKNLKNNEMDIDNSHEERNKNTGKRKTDPEIEEVRKKKMKKSKKEKSQEVEEMDYNLNCSSQITNEEDIKITNEQEVEAVRKKKKKDKKEKLLEKEEIEIVENENHSLGEVEGTFEITSVKKKKKKRDKVKEVSSECGSDVKGIECDKEKKEENLEEKTPCEANEKKEEKTNVNSRKKNCIGNSTKNNVTHNNYTYNRNNQNFSQSSLGFNVPQNNFGYGINNLNLPFNFGHDINSLNILQNNLGVSLNNLNLPQNSLVNGLNNLNLPQNSLGFSMNNCNLLNNSYSLANNQNSNILNLFNFLYSYNYLNNALSLVNNKADGENGVLNHKVELLNEKRVDKFYPGQNKYQKVLRLSHLCDFSSFKGSNIEKLLGYGFKEQINYKKPV